MPTAFLPDEDQGMMLVLIQTPPGTTLERTQRIVKQVADHLRNDESQVVETTFGVTGFSFAGRGQNAGIVFTRFRDWKYRTSPDLKIQAVMARSMAYFSTIKGAMIFPVNPPAIPELGVASGFDLELQDRAGLGHEALMAASPTDANYPSLLATEKSNAAARVQAMSDIKSQIYAVLTPEQRAQVPSLIAAEQAARAQKFAALRAQHEPQ